MSEGKATQDNRVIFGKLVLTKNGNEEVNIHLENCHFDTTNYRNGENLSVYQKCAILALEKCIEEVRAMKLLHPNQKYSVGDVLSLDGVVVEILEYKPESDSPYFVYHKQKDLYFWAKEEYLDLFSDRKVKSWRSS